MQAVPARTYVALLRGVNVGGKTVKMSDLSAAFVALGHSRVATYIQSGNVVFDAQAARPARLRATIEGALHERFGWPITVLVRSPVELAEVLAANPYPGRGADPARIYVTFLTEPPARPVPAPGTLDEEPDEFAVVGTTVYLHCPEGYGRTRLSNALWEKTLGVAATTRNLRTVTKLSQLAARPPG
jgi:uncharacterized protein (DUF1697 family)